jgi:hypothetical protein
MAGTALGLSLEHGGKYYAAVRATSCAGLSTTAFSDGAELDVRAPSTGTVRILGGSLDEAAAQSSSTQLMVAWAGFNDGGHGIAQYNVTVQEVDSGDTEEQGDGDLHLLAPFVTVGLNESALIDGLALLHGHRYAAVVRAVDAAGFHSLARSRPVLVDKTPPHPGSVALPRLRGSTVSATFGGFDDPNSGITAYRFAVGSSALATDLQPFRDVDVAGTGTGSGETSALAVSASLSLAEGTPVFVTVEATNGAGLSRAVSSAGVTVTCSSPPCTCAANFLEV